MNNRYNKRSTQQPDDHGSNHPAKLLYLPAEPFDNVQGTIKKLAEKASENISTWRSRLENRVLSLNYAAREEPTSLAGYQRIPYTVRHPYSKFCGLSNRAAKRAGLLKHPKTIPYEHAILLHNLWTEYVADVLGKHTQPAHIARSLALCDLQGAIIEIQSSQCPSYVGVKGIILTETQNAFNIVKPDSNVITVLKIGTVFTIKWQDWTFHIYGSHLIATPAQRSKRKLKAKATL